MKLKHMIYFDEFPKTINEDDIENSKIKEYDTEDPSNITYDPASASLKGVFNILSKLIAKQKQYRQLLISTDKTNVTNRDIIIKKLESVTREVEFFDSEFQRLLYDEENQYKGKL